MAAGLGAFAGVASAATFTVNDTTDAALSNPAGTACVSTHGGSCTLRGAVQAADNAGGTNSIVLPGGTFTLTIPSTAAANPANGDLDITHGSLTISGAGAANTVINPNHLDRAFAVQAGESLSISSVTVENGSQPNTAPSNLSTAPGDGGAFYNDGALTIDASVLIGNSARSGGAVVYAGAAASATTITNSTVSHNVADNDGGALLANSGSVTFANDTFAHNSSENEAGVLYDDDAGNTVGPVVISASSLSSNVADSDAGAIYLDDAGTLSITDSQLNANNNASSDGGAIYDGSSGAMSVVGSTFNNDDAGSSDGGAIYTDGTDLSVSGSSFSGGGADEGAAIYLEGTSGTAAQTITTSTFANNAATDEGGAIFDDSGALTLTASTFTANNAAEYGGALSYESGDAMTATNDTFEGNQAVTGGAIYFSTTGAATLDNDTIVANSAYYGGGIANPARAGAIENTIIADNIGGSGANGGDCYESTATDNAGAADLGGNIDSDGSCFSDAVTHDHTGVNPLVGSLAANGGLTETVALLAGSPAIDAAINADCPATDQRGVSRPQGASCDIGAYEYAPPANTATPAISGSLTDGQTLACSNGSWSGAPLQSYSYQWLRDGSAISGATGSSYATTIADAGQSLSCVVTENTSDGSASAASAAVTVAYVSNLFARPTMIVTRRNGAIVFRFTFPVAGTLEVQALFGGKHNKRAKYGAFTMTAAAGVAVFKLNPNAHARKARNGDRRAGRRQVVSLTYSFTPLGGLVNSTTKTLIVLPRHR